jgi:hypothetical protein
MMFPPLTGDALRILLISGGVMVRLEEPVVHQD